MILIENGVISSIGGAIAHPEGDLDILDAESGYLIPGLWDSHVHIFSNPTEPYMALPLYLINGVTGIRDMGGSGRLRSSKPSRPELKRATQSALA